MKTIFFGSSHLVLPILDVLKENSDLKLVVTSDNAGTNYRLLTGSVDSYSRLNKIPYTISLFADNKIKDLIRKIKPDLGIVANFGTILDQELIELFPHGILNVHPSLLPKYRGPSPVPSAILNGEAETGVTLIKIDNQIDHGPIIDQAKHRLRNSDTSGKVLDLLFLEGAKLLKNNLDGYVSGKIEPREQNHTKAVYTKLMKKDDGFVDIDNPPGKDELNRMIRAYFPWPGTWTKHKLTNKENIIKLLPGEKIQVEGKNSMSYKDFINGYPKGKFFLQKLSLI